MPTPSGPPPRYDDFADERIKHLEFVQAVIARLGNDSFLVKGWAVTVAGVFLGFAVNNDDHWLAVLSWAPTVAFWGLDTYFLRSERLFRALYEEIRKGTSAAPPFFMGATAPSFMATLKNRGDTTGSWIRTAVRPTLLVFYLGLLAAAALVAVAVC